MANAYARHINGEALERSIFAYDYVVMIEEAQRIFPDLRTLGEEEIKAAWSGRVYYTLDDYPFVERALDGQLTTFAAPSDQGNALAVKVGQLIGGLAADAVLGTGSERDAKQRSLHSRVGLGSSFLMTPTRAQPLAFGKIFKELQLT